MDNISKMTTEQKARCFEVLSDSCFEFVANMNDTFAYACGDAETFDDYDLDRLAPLIVEYGHDALVAYAAVKRDQDPIECACNHRNSRYYAAKEKIREIRERDKLFMEAQ